MNLQLKESAVTCIIFRSYVTFYKSVYELIDVIIENLSNICIKIAFIYFYDLHKYRNYKL